MVQANLLAATAQAAAALNQAYNVARGRQRAPDSSTTVAPELYAQLHRNLLPHYPQLESAKPMYRDFRAGDVRHSLADIGKAQRLLGYAPTQRCARNCRAWKMSTGHVVHVTRGTSCALPKHRLRIQREPRQACLSQLNASGHYDATAIGIASLSKATGA